MAHSSIITAAAACALLATAAFANVDQPRDDALGEYRGPDIPRWRNIPAGKENVSHPYEGTTGSGRTDDDGTRCEVISVRRQDGFVRRLKRCRD